MENQKVELWTDGACSGNPGPGGYGAVLISGDRRKELSAGYQRTTNNRMEMLAVIEGLRALKKPCQVTVYSDSRYVVDAVTKRWIDGWRRRGWIKSDRKPVLNRDLWEAMIEQLDRHDVKFVWVEGHSGVRENERCDELAVTAAKGPALLQDRGCDK